MVRATPRNRDRTALALRLFDRAALALALGAAHGRFVLAVGSQDGGLGEPRCTYQGRGWEGVAGFPPPGAADALAPGWGDPHSREDYRRARAWLAGALEAACWRGFHGRVRLALRGHGGRLTFDRAASGTGERPPPG